MGGNRQDPYLGFRFRIEIDGIIVGGFYEASGLQAETQVEEFREGGVNNYIHRLPKETRYPNLVLKRGLMDSDALWNWHQDVVQGVVSRKTIHLILLDNQGKDSWRWTFEQAYPIKWSGTEFKADAASLAFETIELAHNGFKKY